MAPPVQTVRGMRSIAYGLVAVVACGGDSVPPGEPDFSCDSDPDPHCDHPIDRLVIPRLRELGSGPRDATPDEVCRRMAIDLIGRAPNDAERATCRTQTIAQMADTFLASPELARTQRRAWGELAKYESLLVWSPDLVDLDLLVGRMYSGEVDYPEFVRQYVVHPAFYALHPDDSWTANVFQIFLGRPARQDEIDAARPLTQLWTARAYCGREVFWNFYSSAIGNGANETDAVELGNRLCYDGAKVEWGVNLCRCQPDLLDAGCFSDVFGELVRIEPLCIAPVERDPSNFRRLAVRTPTDEDDLCPDDVTHRAECQDRGRGQVQYTFEAFDEREELPADGHAELRKIGDALLARADLWETVADRELRKLLGWWQATFKHPDSDLPEVRALLADRLRAGMTVREMIKLIVTSQLYVQPVAAPDLLDALVLPPWAAGPAKLLSGESWLASAAIVVGETSGTCDFRWGQGGDYEPHWADPRLVENTRGSFELLVPPVPPYGYTIRAIQRLGGCTGDSRRAEVSNVGLAFSQSAIARELCAVGRGVVPANWNGELDDAASYLIERAWNRPATAAELVPLVDEMQACISAGSNIGCANATVAARWLCRRLIDSVEFSTY